MDWSTINPFASITPEHSSVENWTVDNSKPHNIKKTNQKEDEALEAGSERMQGAEITSTRGAPVINDIAYSKTNETAVRGKPNPSPSDYKASASNSTKQNPGSADLTSEEKEQVRELKEQDAKVRRHEQAHVMAGGRYIKNRAQFQYELGPDGKLYAVSGEVQIDTSEVQDDPDATIQKAQTVRRAALAPSDPSPQDRRVASEANRMEFEARMELVQQRAEELRPTDESSKEEQTNRFPSEPNLLDLFI